MKNAQAPSRAAELLAREKLLKLRFNWYMERGFARLLTPRFLVPKVVENGVILDVRCVWDCRINGLNAAVWSPGFMFPDCQDGENMVIKWLPCRLAIYLQQGSPEVDYSKDPKNFVKSKQVDIDVGQHFNNFRLHKSDQPFLGVRVTLTNNNPEEEEQEEWWRFTVLPFGLKASPYIACQGQARITELAKGDTCDPKNPFHFSTAVLNLPCARNYDPSLPRVLLLREDGEMAT